MDPDADSASSTDDVQSAADENLFITDMHKEIQKFTAPDALTTEKIEAVNHIGYIAYIGGEATTNLQKSFLPELSCLLTDESCTYLVKTRVLITLSLMAYGNQSVQNALCSDHGLLEALLKIISDTEEEYLCHLACNLLLNAVIGNITAMKKIKDMPEVEKSLIDAARMNVTWMPWSENLADTLLKLLGFRSLRRIQDWPSVKSSVDISSIWTEKTNLCAMLSWLEAFTGDPTLHVSMSNVAFCIYGIHAKQPA